MAAPYVELLCTATASRTTPKFAMDALLSSYSSTNALVDHSMLLFLQPLQGFLYVKSLFPLVVRSKEVCSRARAVGMTQ